MSIGRNYFSFVSQNIYIRSSIHTDHASTLAHMRAHDIANSSTRSTHRSILHTSMQIKTKRIDRRTECSFPNTIHFRGRKHYLATIHVGSSGRVPALDLGDSLTLLAGVGFLFPMIRRTYYLASLYEYVCTRHTRTTCNREQHLLNALHHTLSRYDCQRI